MQAWIKWIFSHVSISVKFCHVCATSARGISWQHLNHPNLLVSAVYRFHVCFNVRLILHDLGISSPRENSFSKVKNAYIESAYYSIRDDYGVDADETWLHGDWFYLTGCGIFGHEVKATRRSPPDNLTRWIITQSEGFIRKGIGKTKGCNNKILVSIADIKIGSNRDIQKDHKKLPTPDTPKIVIPHDNPKMLTEKHNDWKLTITLLIVGAGLIAYHFFYLKVFFNNHTIFHYIKLKLHQNDINKKKTLHKAEI